jgi:uncharacterized protein YgfB (UPF0149 family)
MDRDLSEAKTFAVWIVMCESGDCEVATDEVIALDRWKDQFGDGLGLAVGRVVKLSVTMSEPVERDGDQSESDVAVNVVVPDEAGSVVELETQ